MGFRSKKIVTAGVGIHFWAAFLVVTLLMVLNGFDRRGSGTVLVLSIAGLIIYVVEFALFRGRLVTGTSDSISGRKFLFYPRRTLNGDLSDLTLQILKRQENGQFEPVPPAEVNKLTLKHQVEIRIEGTAGSLVLGPTMSSGLNVRKAYQRFDEWKNHTLNT